MLWSVLKCYKRKVGAGGPGSRIQSHRKRYYKTYIAGPLAQGVSETRQLFSLPSFLLPIFFPTSHRRNSLLPIVWKLEVGRRKLEVRSWKLFFVVLECAHACLRREQGGPWAPGAPPQGAIPTQTTTLTWCYGLLGIASKSMLNLMLFFDCFVLDFGSVWECLFDHFGALVAPCWYQTVFEPSSIRKGGRSPNKIFPDGF